MREKNTSVCLRICMSENTRTISMTHLGKDVDEGLSAGVL